MSEMEEEKKEEETIEIPKSELLKWLEEIKELRRSASGQG